MEIVYDNGSKKLKELYDLCLQLVEYMQKKFSSRTIV